MTYISKGAVLKESDRERITVNRCGGEYVLEGRQAEIWLAGRFGVAAAVDKLAQSDYDCLEHCGLIEVSDADAGIAGYRLLSNCVICRSAPPPCRALLGRKERQVWKWIAGAGFKLRISELVLLLERNIKPVPALLGEENWHTLVDMLYTTETIFDGILDASMERSPARSATVDAVLGLLRKGRILLA